MSSDRPTRGSWNQRLALALRAIRRSRLMRAVDIARRMNMPLRSYEHFEAGGGRLNLERVLQFAQITDSDPYAILAAVMIGSPEFALRAADNKLMTAFMITLQEFNTDAGDDITRLDTGALITAFSQAFQGLLAQSKQKRDAWAETWLSEKSPTVGIPRSPKPIDDPQDDS